MALDVVFSPYQRWGRLGEATPPKNSLKSSVIQPVSRRTKVCAVSQASMRTGDGAALPCK